MLPVFVGTGTDVLIAGIIVQNADKKILVRAVGPSLTGFGIANAMTDPQLELHDKMGNTIATNNDWQTTQIGGVIAADQSTDIQNSGFGAQLTERVCDNCFASGG